MIAPAACPACERSEARFFGEKNGRALWRCHECGVIFTAPDASVSRELYRHYYDDARFESPSTVAASLDRVVRAAECYRKTGRWLDIGYGKGALLSSAEKRGWTCHGVELSPQALSFGERRGWIVTNDAGDSRLCPDCFDVVTMIELVEHLDAPRRFLKTAALWLRPGGLLYITTPNADSLNRRTLGLRWSVVAPPEHVTLWTARALTRALENSGFGVVRVRTEGLNPADLVVPFRANRNGPPVNRNEIGRALAETLSRSRTKRLLKATINESLNLVRLGDTLKVWGRRVE